jgi:hypothetical protein
MKRYQVIITALLFYIPISMLHADEGTRIRDQWIRFSAACQNATSYVQTMQRTAGGNTEIMKELITEISEAIGNLVASGELISKEFHVSPPSTWPREGEQEFGGFIEELNKRFGDQVAGEMIGMGIRSRLKGSPKDSESVVLESKLPKEISSKLGEILVRHKMISDKK